MVAVFFMKSGLIKLISIRNSCNGERQLVCEDMLVTSSSQSCLNEEKARDLRGLIFHDDNAKPHRAWINNKFLLENHVEQYENVAYSPDMKSLRFLLLCWNWRNSYVVFGLTTTMKCSLLSNKPLTV